METQDKKAANGDVDGEIMRICEVEEVEIDESFKKLISTASVRFPRGTIIRKTITNQTNEEEEDFKKSVCSCLIAALLKRLELQHQLLHQVHLAWASELKYT